MAVGDFFLPVRLSLILLMLHIAYLSPPEIVFCLPKSQTCEKYGKIVMRK